MKNIYLVDQNSGPFKTIQEAIDTAKPFSQIKISPGIYIENLIITKNGLTIMSKNEINDVTIISVKRPTISIDLKKDETCSLIGLKISHSGNKND